MIFATEGGISDLFGMPWITADFPLLATRLGLNMLVMLVLVRLIYYPIAKRKDYLFTYFVISIIVFFVCFMLRKLDLKLGVGLGLFALFGIIRYRTDPIPIKEMTYLFVVIGLSVVNAMANQLIGLAEILLTNTIVILTIFGLERLWLLKHESRKTVTYDKIGLILPERQEELIADLEMRTGLKINRVEVGRIDFLRDTANVRVFFFEDEQIGSFEERDSSVDD